MDAVALWTWVGALVLGLVVLGFLGHEIGWKVRRLRGDVARLGEVRAGLAELQAGAATAGTTVAAIRQRP